MVVSSRCVDNDVVGDGVVGGFAHGVGDDADDVNGCRTQGSCRASIEVSWDR